MRVLLVDDDAAGLEVRRLILERRGFEIDTASSAGEARETFLKRAPDVVLLDLRIPEVENGLALIREFRSARVVVLCGNIADLDHRPEAAMASAILRKPVRSEEMISTIRGES